MSRAMKKLTDREIAELEQKVAEQGADIIQLRFDKQHLERLNKEKLEIIHKCEDYEKTLEAQCSKMRVAIKEIDERAFDLFQEIETQKFGDIKISDRSALSISVLMSVAKQALSDRGME